MFDGADLSVQLLYVTPVQLMAWSERVRPHLARMAETSGGRYEAGDILTAVAASRMHLWAMVRGADLLGVLATEIHQYPRLRAMRLIGLVGHRPLLWRRLLSNLEASAKRDFGCSVMEAMHLPRFEVLLPGFRPTHCFSEKVIEG